MNYNRRRTRNQSMSLDLCVENEEEPRKSDDSEREETKEAEVEDWRGLGLRVGSNVTWSRSNEKWPPGVVGTVVGTHKLTRVMVTLPGVDDKFCVLRSELWLAKKFPSVQEEYHVELDQPPDERSRTRTRTRTRSGSNPRKEGAKANRSENSSSMQSTRSTPSSERLRSQTMWMRERL